jgi:S-adenosylmethionine hydrolase
MMIIIRVIHSASVCESFGLTQRSGAAMHPLWSFYPNICALVKPDGARYGRYMVKIITLCTDFGLADGYVAAMKGVILSLAPEVTLVDITHLVPPQDIFQGAFILAGVAPFFPPSTIHLAVIDPGVGSERRAVAIESDGCYYVGPDNGLFSLALAGAVDVRAVSLTQPAYWRIPRPSATFHGRDIFAAVAGHLAAGVPLAAFGKVATDLARLAIPAPTSVAPGDMRGQVISVDHFGNLITNIPAETLAPSASWRISIGGNEILGLSRIYSTARPGALLALIGSHGYLEIARCGGSAAEALPAQIGTPLAVSAGAAMARELR